MYFFPSAVGVIYGRAAPGLNRVVFEPAELPCSFSQSATPKAVKEIRSYLHRWHG